MFPSTSSIYSNMNGSYVTLQHQQQQKNLTSNSPMSNAATLAANGRQNSNDGNISPARMSLHSATPSFVLDGATCSPSIGDSASLILAAADESLSAQPSSINLQVFVPELQIQKCLTVALDELVWDIKYKIFESMSQKFQESYNYGLFLPPCDGRAGKFLLEDRPIREYPFHDCVPYVELKYKKRVYKMLQLDEKIVKNLHSKSNLKKFMECVQSRNAEKIEKMCQQGIDPNFHDAHGYTPLTLAAEIPDNREVLVQLVGGGAHLDFRSHEGQTGLHRAAFLSLKSNVKTLLELGASPNYRDLIGLTPLYYNMLTTDSDPLLAELLLSEGAEIFVHDMHANDPLHQACKNGLTKHAEHLLFYGGNINAQNVNGNTPLHVCAVNNRVDCTRMLLYRGADPNILNKYGQTAKHVAHIVNNAAVADAIQTHNLDHIVPFNGTPKYNTRRRLANAQIQRRRSLSHSSMNSMQSANDCYQVPVIRPHQSGAMHKCSTSINDYSATVGNGNYGTLKKYPPELIHSAIVEPNIPRILVIPRGPKGFGFILRGANHLDPHAPPFEPTPAVPALQFFEGVETTGMAMKAGLRPGDFLLEINGIDVRCASHEQVVELINQSEDTISLKIITIDQNLLMIPQINTNYHYAPSSVTMRRNQSVPRNSSAYGGALPPIPPQRNPVTTLSYNRFAATSSNTISTANGYAIAQQEEAALNRQKQQQFKNNYSQQQLSYVSSSSTSSNYGLQNNSDLSNYNNNANKWSGAERLALSSSAASDSSVAGVALSTTRRFSPPNTSCSSALLANDENGAYLRGSGVSSEHYAPGSNSHYRQQLRCASVKSRPSPSRRISAAELEHLMIRQSTSCSPNNNTSTSSFNSTESSHGTLSFSQFQPPPSFLNYNQDSIKSESGSGPKKFTSIAEMKRRKEQNNPTIQRANSSGSAAAASAVRQSVYESTDDSPANETYGRFRGDLKSFNSTPDLAANFRDTPAIDGDEISEYSPRQQFVLRPKTPPPPPPSQNVTYANSTSGKRTTSVNSTSNAALPYANNNANNNSTNVTVLYADNNNAQISDETIYASTSLTEQKQKRVKSAENAQQLDSVKSVSSNVLAAPLAAAPPPPPPPPPPNFLKNLPLNNTNSSNNVKLTNVPKESDVGASTNLKTADCRGISAEALLSVKLKKVAAPSLNSPKIDAKSLSLHKASSSPSAHTKITDKPASFDLDLRSALARRRSKVCSEEDEEAAAGNLTAEKTNERLSTNCAKFLSETANFSIDNGKSTQASGKLKGSEVKALTGSVVGRYGGLSLRESVHETVQSSSKNGEKVHASHHHHSPTGGLSFATKKDSGYTSSRTSLEPSECGDDPQPRSQQQQQSMSSSASSSSNTLVDSSSLADAVATSTLDGTVQIEISPTKSTCAGGKFGGTNQVTLISQQLEDNYGNPLNRMTIDRTSPLSLDNRTIYRQSAVTETVSRQLFLENPLRTPPADYDNDDNAVTVDEISVSNTHKSSPKLNIISGDSDDFRVKPLLNWSVDDVSHWLVYLRLADHYARNFATRGVDGIRLAQFGRAQFTQMGVTRVAHRQAMENSLKEFHRGK